MKKRALTLIEVMISLGLLSLLIATLFFWYNNLSKRKEEFLKLKNPLMEERYALQRLQKILPSAATPFFTSTDNGLVFLFEHPLCANPHLSSQVLGKLYFDKEAQCLCLGVWPKPEKENAPKSPSYTTILLDGVSSCFFEFYYPPNPLKLTVDPEAVGKPQPFEGWQKEWLSTYQTLPALVKICVTRDAVKGLKEHSFDYCFDLPATIVYLKEGVI